MLVLTRRLGESIRIGHDVVVTVVDVRGDQVRIGIDAPREVVVNRQEVYEELVAQNTAAAEGSDQARRVVARFPANARRRLKDDR